jgi:hypothetical protein
VRVGPGEFLLRGVQPEQTPLLDELQQVVAFDPSAAAAILPSSLPSPESSYVYSPTPVSEAHRLGVEQSFARRLGLRPRFVRRLNRLHLHVRSLGSVLLFYCVLYSASSRFLPASRLFSACLQQHVLIRWT